MNKTLKKSLLFTAILSLCFPVFVSAAVVAVPQQLLDLIETFTIWGETIAGSLAVLFIILAGINFIWNGGDPSKVEKARNMILYAAIGLAIVMLSTTIKIIAESLVGVDDASTSTSCTSSLTGTTCTDAGGSWNGTSCDCP